MVLSPMDLSCLLLYSDEKLYQNLDGLVCNCIFGIIVISIQKVREEKKKRQNNLSIMVVSLTGGDVIDGQLTIDN